jgi:hypothetical protein
MSRRSLLSIELLAHDGNGVSNYRVSSLDDNFPIEELVSVSYKHDSHFPQANDSRYSEDATTPQKALENALHNFDRATHRMMLEEGPYEVIAPAQIPNKVKPCKLAFKEKKDEKTFLYVVTFETSSGSKDYTFQVTGGEIPGINFNDDFFEELGKTTQFADSLLAAILEFTSPEALYLNDSNKTYLRNRERRRLPLLSRVFQL